MSEFNTCLRRGFVQFGDDFNTVAEVTGVFGRNAKKLPFRVTFEIPGKPDVVVCLYSEDGGEGWHNERKFGPATDARGWNEVLSVVEWNDDLATSKARIEEELAHPKAHYVFYRECRQGSLWYKFYGEVKVDPDATRATLSTDRPAVVYRRTSKTVECLKVEEVHQTFTKEELDDFVGRPVTVKFLDEIDFVADCGEKVEGSVAAMPGAWLFVNAVNRGAETVVCGSTDEALLEAVKMHVPAELREKVSGRTASFTVPLKDFRLGYMFANDCVSADWFFSDEK